MRARLVNRDGNTATVLVTPSWIARLFGARPYLLRCVRTSSRWVTEATQRDVPRLMLDAIDREEWTEWPKAIAAPVGSRWRSTEAPGASQGQRRESEAMKCQVDGVHPAPGRPPDPDWGSPEWMTRQGRKKR